MAARLRHEGETQSAVTPEQVQQVLDRILASKYFLHAPMKRKFLRLVCDYYLDDRAAHLNEYLIGHEVFERDGSYNPAADPIVRVGAHDLRKKLKLYYEGEGANDDIRLEIPVGGYEPVFVRLKTPATETAAPSQPSLVTQKFIKRAMFNTPLTALGLIIFALMVAVAVLWSANRELRRRITQSTQSADEAACGAVWQPFLKGGGQTLVVLNNTRQALRVNLPDGRFTGVGEAIGLYRITEFFRSAGTSVVPVQRRIASAEDLKNHNLILLGDTLAGESSGDLALTEDFYFGASSAIENRSPLASESRQYRPEFDQASGSLRVDYALITVKPNISFLKTVMVLAGTHGEGTEAASRFVTTRECLDELNRRLEQLSEDSTPPRYYQALLRVGVENGVPTTITCVALHELRVRQD